ncbi:hypothetical protein CDAR_85001 [Caerostris darwini]|uniref:Uncharacterized protein n=1 Tax=Caerostris darwini TaxID=1538125 RepID=A0AAV4N0Q7_9ARAC|nr:hypothetical protein CDAR_85001 [Caerostris darwini]
MTQTVFYIRKSTSRISCRFYPYSVCRRYVEQRRALTCTLADDKVSGGGTSFSSEQNSIVPKFRDGSCSTSSDYSGRELRGVSNSNRFLRVECGICCGKIKLFFFEGRGCG